MSLRNIVTLSLLPVFPLLVMAALPTSSARIREHVAPAPERGADLPVSRRCFYGADDSDPRCHVPDARYADAIPYVEEDLDKLVA